MAMRRMNEMWRWVAPTLFLCILIVHSCQGQQDPTMDPTNTNPTDGNNFTMSSTQSLNQANIPTSASQQNTSNTTDSTVNLPSDDGTVFLNPINQGTGIAPLDTSGITEVPTSLDTYKTSSGGSNTVDLSPVSEEKSREQGGSRSHSSKGRDPSSTQAPNVFVPLLVSGLVLAAALIGVYVWKNHCHLKSKDMKVAEASVMADEENQGNTLVSVAPLNSLESQEKTSQNGEFLEAVKTQNPPAATNGHSATKADTEL